MKKPLIIGITGGTSSGKSTVSRKISDCIPEKKILVIQQDSYYKDQSDIPYEKRVKENYDHPFAFDNELLISHLQDLIDGKDIDIPIYDFEQYNRRKEVNRVSPKEIIILEGLLILNEERIRDFLDIKIFVDTDADVRILRRIVRDIEKRGRTLESVVEQYLGTVRPSHLQFVEPSKRYADIIIPEGGYNSVAIDILTSKVKSIVEGKEE